MARSSGAEPTPVEVRRSARRRRTVSAYREADRVVVLLPAKFSRAEEQEWVRRMLDRLAAREQRRRPGDEELLERSRQLARRYLPDHPAAADPASVRWVDNQNGRWGSCTPLDRTIRISSRLRGMPGWVIDYVLLHEIAHLVVAGHGPDFWRLLAGYPRTERARGYLEGVAAAAGLDLAEDLGDDLDAATAPERSLAGSGDEPERSDRRRARRSTGRRRSRKPPVGHEDAAARTSDDDDNDVARG